MKLKALDPNLPGETARLFAAGKISSPLTDWGITFSPGGDEIYYTVSVKKKMVIVGMKWRSGQWTDPEVVSFSGVYPDATPNIAGDGERMIFVSGRPTEEGDEVPDKNIWCVHRDGSSWGTPYPLTVVNTGENEFFPCLARNGDLYFCVRCKERGKKVHIYVSKYQKGKYGKPEPLKGKINTEYGEYCPFVSPDGSYMIVELAGAPGGSGGGDLYISRKQNDGSWGKPVNLGLAFNSPGNDCYPVLSPDGKYLIFMSDRKPYFEKSGNRMTYKELLWQAAGAGGEAFDFYWIDAAALKPFLK